MTMMKSNTADPAVIKIRSLDIVRVQEAASFLVNTINENNQMIYIPFDLFSTTFNSWMDGSLIFLIIPVLINDIYIYLLYFLLQLSIPVNTFGL